MIKMSIEKIYTAFVTPDNNTLEVLLLRECVKNIIKTRKNYSAWAFRLAEKKFFLLEKFDIKEGNNNKTVYTVMDSCTLTDNGNVSTSMTTKGKDVLDAILHEEPAVGYGSEITDTDRAEAAKMLENELMS